MTVDLERFVAAQDNNGTYDDAVRELRAGRKTSHWMWFVFPQLAGLGKSATAQHFALAGIAEAQAYLAHPVLGPRLVDCAGILAGLGERSAVRILGSVDALKLHSSMTLFAVAAPHVTVFAKVLDHYFAGHPDPGTTALLTSERA